MGSSFRQFVLNKIPQKNPAVMSKYGQAREFVKLKVTIWHLAKDFIAICLGIVSAGFGLKSFLLPNSFIDGGVTGISLLTSRVTQLPLPILIVVINIPFLILGYTQIGKLFAVKSILAISGLALALVFIEYPVITTDTLLVAAFGGFFLGAGIGLSVRGGAVLDGTEILAISLSRKTGLTIGDIILIFNVLIFSVSISLISSLCDEIMVTPVYSSTPSIIKSMVLEAARYVKIEYKAISMVSK
jgi:uncharacterized membrane-anchored protein YitT (DUF2179 family)